MRILFLLNSDIRQEQRVNKEMATLRRAGHFVSLVYLPAADATADADADATQHPVRIWTRRLPRNLAFWPLKYIECTIRLVRSAVRLKPQVLHAVDRLSLLPGLLTAQWLGIPLIYDTQEIWPEVNSALNRPRWLWLAFERYAARRTIHVLVTDRFRRDLTANLLRLPPERLTVLMNLPNREVVAALDRSDIRVESGFAGNALLVYAGGLSPGRHLEECIGALGRLPSQYALTLVGFGDPAYKRQLIELAGRLGVSDRVAMLPPVPWSAIADYIRSADCAFAFYEKSSINNLYCSPSKLFDALLAGVPVVGTDNPLIVEVLSALDAGQTVADVTPETIAQAVTAVMNCADGSKRRAHIAAMARDTYTWEHQESVLHGIYEQLECSR